MRIVVNDLAASQSGAMTVLKSFYEYIRKNDSDNEYIFLISGNYLEETSNIKIKKYEYVKKSGFHKLWFDLVVGKRELAALHPDRVISLQNIITFGYRGIQDVYIHQSIPFQNDKKFSFIKPEERTFAKYQYIIGSFIKKSARHARRVFVQTEWMKKSVAQKANISDEKISVIPPDKSVDSGCRYDCDLKHFFYPAAFENVYKNHQCIFEANRILKARGISDFNVTLTLPENHEETEGCSFIGLLNKEDLFFEYSQSILVFPSYIETVGLPLVEAMSVGAIIFVADCEYAHEVVGTYENAYFFNPFNPCELADLMEKAISGQIELNERNITSNETPVEKGWKNLLDFLMQ